jgi:hypothetical protein
MLPSEYACPRCECHACYALHRKGFDKLLSLFGLRPARCLTCGRKFFTRYTVAEDGKFVLNRDSKSTTKSEDGRDLDQAA